MRLVLGVAIGLAIMMAATWITTHRYVSYCAEDVVLVGQGDFERGRWNSYECGPAVDD